MFLQYLKNKKHGNETEGKGNDLRSIKWMQLLDKQFPLTFIIYINKNKTKHVLFPVLIFLNQK